MPPGPVPEMVVAASRIGLLMVSPVAEVCGVEVTGSESGLCVPPGAVARAVIAVPCGIDNPVTVQKPFWLTEVGEPTAVPAANTCMLVPAGSVEVPVTVVVTPQ